MNSPIYELEQSTKTKEQKILEGDKYSKKVSNFIDYPNSSLLILSDFDHTFTKSFFSGKRILSSFQLVERSNKLSEKILPTSKELAAKYSKFERDITVPFEDRLEKVKLWYNTSLENIAAQKVTKMDFISFIEEAIQREEIMFRKGLKNFFALIKEKNIPLIILSGGVSEIIEAALIRLLGKNEYDYFIKNNLLVIVANQFSYDSEGKSFDRKTPIIHAFNKKEMTNNAIVQLGKEGGNFIVLGDHLNDIDMINNSKFNDLIGVGYENFSSGANFLDKYDVCIQGDGDFDFVVEMLEKITKTGK